MSWLIGKHSDAGRDWGQEEKGKTEDEMAGWHPWLDGREFEWTPGAGGGQGGLVWCDSWGCKGSDKTELLNWTERCTHSLIVRLWQWLSVLTTTKMHHWLDGRESEWTPGVGDGQAGGAYCDSWGRKESDTTERLIWTELNWTEGD